MKSITAFCLIALGGSLGGWAADVKGSNMQKHSVKPSEIKMRIGSKSFGVTLLDNESTERLKDMLPLTIRMKDLHGNEKYYDLPKALPTNASNPKTINAGDIMLYGSNTLVVFYDSFPTSYNYTRLGRVTDPAGLKTALGTGDVTLSFGSE